MILFVYVFRYVLCSDRLYYLLQFLLIIPSQTLCGRYVYALGYYALCMFRHALPLPYDTVLYAALHMTSNVIYIQNMLCIVLY